MPARISLDQVLTAPAALTVPEAVAVIVQLSRAPQTGRPRPVPLEPCHVWLERSGAVTLEPGLLPRLGEFAALLDRLLAPLANAVPRGLQTLIDRASGHGDAATIRSFSAFAAALAPFQPPDPAAAVRDIVARVDRASHSAPAQAVPPPPIPVVIGRISRPADPPAARVAAPIATPVAAPVARPVARPVATVPLQPPATATPDPSPASWRPLPWHIGTAVAATVLAAVLGGALARSQADAPLVTRPPAASAAASATPGPSPEPASAALAPPEPIPLATSTPGVTRMAITPPPLAARSLAAAPDEPATAIADRLDPPAPMDAPSPQPARLVDRRDVAADAVFSPSFATSGSAVFFHAQTPRGSALKRADVDGGELRVASIVDDGARNYHVQLSPDGRHVAFDSDRDGVRGVYLADADGRGVRRISGPGYAAVPTWSPDGRRLAFIRAEPDRPAVWNLWLHDRDTGRDTRLTGFRRGQVWGGAWFADGRRIAYSHEDRLTIHDLATGRRRDVASPVAGRLVRTPAVSPDGRLIVFQVFRDGVWLFDVEDGTMRRVLDDASAEEFAWSPDGRRVAYHSRRSGGWNLWTMAAP